MAAFVTWLLVLLLQLSGSASLSPGSFDSKVLYPELSAYYVSLAEDASPIEAHAAQSLSNLTGLPIQTPGQGKQLAVGSGAANHVDPLLDLSGLGDEGFVLAAPGESLVATGGVGAARGTLYAVYALLEQMGWRFWTPTVTDVPSSPKIPSVLNVRTLPAFEYRETNSFTARHQDTQEWAAGAMRYNGDAFSGATKPGGGITYAAAAGPVHTAFHLVDPSLNVTYPEWFSEDMTQLCWANESLVAYLTERVLDILANDTSANIISVSQNDGHGYCTRPADQAIIDEEGSPSGPILRTVNVVAEAVQSRFPHVAVDTLAYVYSRKPPSITKPQPNVIIRLCSFECDFGHSIAHPANAEFYADLVGWGNLTSRVYIWDYVVDFSNSMMPWPNYAVLGENIALFSQHSVKGIFEEADYWANGGDLAHLKAYVMAKAVWDPTVDAAGLVTEFINGYYGLGAPYVLNYMLTFLNSEAKMGLSFTMRENVKYTAPYLDCDSVLTAALNLDNGIKAMGEDPKAPRLQLVSLMPLYVGVLRWDEMAACANYTAAWPWPETKQASYDWFANLYRAFDLDGGDSGAISERGYNLTWFCQTANVTDPVAGCV